MTICHTFRTF